MRRREFDRSLTLEKARRDIAARIGRVCQDFCQEEFDALVQRMAEIDVRYRMRDEWAALRTVLTPRLN